MTSPGQVTGATQQAAGQTAATAKDEAAQVGQTAAAAASEVADTAKEQVGQVAGEAVDQVRQLTEQARAQVGAQAGNATGKLSESVRALASEVRQLSQGQADGSGTVAGLAQQLADKGEQFADYLSQQGPGGLVSELRSFAARRPGGFLVGALAAGLTTGRVVKGASAASSATDASAQASAGVPAYVPAAPVLPAASHSMSDAPPYTEPMPSVEPNPAASTGSGGFDRPASDSDRGLSGSPSLLDEPVISAPPYPPGSGMR